MKSCVYEILRRQPHPASLMPVYWTGRHDEHSSKARLLEPPLSKTTPTALTFLVLQPTYNESMPNGGDPLEMDVNAQYVGFEYNYTYLIFCGFIVWLIIPGIGLLYGGMARRKSALALLFQSLMVGAVTTFQWMFWGFSLAYSRTAGP